jgi:hypothetical protein
MRPTFVKIVMATVAAVTLFAAVPCDAYQYRPTPSYSSRTYNARTYNARTYNARTYNWRTQNSRR